MSFEYEYRKFDEVRGKVTSFAVSCSEKLRKQHSLCNHMMIFIESNRFSEHPEEAKRYDIAYNKRHNYLRTALITPPI
jgi:DNA polymerase V